MPQKLVAVIAIGEVAGHGAGVAGERLRGTEVEVAQWDEPGWANV